MANGQPPGAMGVAPPPGIAGGSMHYQSSAGPPSPPAAGQQYGVPPPSGPGVGGAYDGFVIAYFRCLHLASAEDLFKTRG